MRNAVFLLLLLGIFCNAFCQPFTVTYSEPIKELPRTHILPINDGGFVGMKKEDKRGVGNWNKFRRLITLIQYDKSMKPIRQIDLAERNLAFGVFFSEFKKIGDKYFLLYIEPAEKNTIGDLKAIEINPSSLETSTPKTIISSEVIDLDLKLFYGLSDLWVKMKVSPDQHKIGFTIMTGKAGFFTACFNDALEVEWSKNQTNQGGEMKLFGIETDNKGNLYLPFKREEEGFVAVYGKDFSKILSLGLEKGKAEDICLLAQKSAPVVAVSGMYYGDTKNLAGVYRAAVNIETQSLSELSKTPFPANIIELFDKDGFGHTKAGKYGIEPGFLLRLVELKDGTIDLIAEAKQVISHPSITVLHSGAILNVYFGSQTPVFTRLPKYNVSAGTYWEHYTAFPFGKKMIIFYNDNPVNLTKEISQSPKLVDIEDKSVLVAAVIEPDGQATRLLPLELSGKYMAIAEYIQPIADQTLVVPVQGEKKKNMFAAISLQ